jgi:hypothetical protein
MTFNYFLLILFSKLLPIVPTSKHNSILYFKIIYDRTFGSDFSYMPTQILQCLHHLYIQMICSSSPLLHRLFRSYIQNSQKTITVNKNYVVLLIYKSVILNNINNPANSAMCIPTKYGSNLPYIMAPSQNKHILQLCCVT